jgi:hypothetical protein
MISPPMTAKGTVKYHILSGGTAHRSTPSVNPPKEKEGELRVAFAFVALREPNRELLRLKVLGPSPEAVIAMVPSLRGPVASSLNALPCVESNAGIVEGSNHRQVEQGDISWIHCLLLSYPSG